MKLPIPKRDIPKRALAVVVILAAVAGVVTGRERPALDIIQEKSPARAEARIDIDLAKLERAEQAADEIRECRFESQLDHGAPFSSP